MTKLTITEFGVKRKRNLSDHEMFFLEEKVIRNKSMTIPI